MRRVCRYVPHLKLRRLGLRIGLMAALALWAMTTATGCGPIEYISIVTFDASKAVNEAKASRASELAPYEYTAAVEYLHKAREVGGYARYHEAATWGRKSRDFGNLAAKLARERSSATDAPPKAPMPAGDL
jgi:uncharacterized protein DUF4398